ncbi:MAG: class I SAM-dependent methyltransferase [Pseudonocardiaceae bacterium]
MDDRVDGTRLSGVPETTLWTLHNRASEAARPDALIHDPWAMYLRSCIDHPYQRAFGEPSQSHALRARCFDQAMREFLAEHPGATVVSLGEGLETGFWRIADPQVRWVSVDLPEIIALREQLLPAEPQVCNVACSALDRSWMDAVAPDADVLISAQGLLMYFQPREVFTLINQCARRFPGGRMIFDTIPPWFSRRTLSGWALSPRYTAPPMPFGITVRQLARFPQRLPAIATVTDIQLPRGRGFWGWPAPFLSGLPVLRAHRPAISLVTFADRPS